MNPKEPTLTARSRCGFLLSTFCTLVHKKIFVNVLKYSFYVTMKETVKDKSGKKPLEALISEKGLTLKQLAEQSGVSYHSLLSYNIGRRSPTLEAATKVCKALNCSFKELALALDIDISGVPDDSSAR